MKRDVIADLLARLKINPVLLDIGASGAPPRYWKPIASRSVYIGFDPDLREINERQQYGFARYVLVDKAVASDKLAREATFYFTRYPLCSSTLQPDFRSLADFLYRDFFAVETEKKVQASNLDQILSGLSVDRVHWLKIDSQGTDLKLIESLGDQYRSGILALDIEPGLASAYLDEDLFADAHGHLTKEGFWLAGLHIQKAVRMRQESLQSALGVNRDINYNLYNSFLPGCPTACEARYLRTLAHMESITAKPQDYVLLWIFALLSNQIGFTMDVVLEYEKRFGVDEFSCLMRSRSETEIKKTRPLKRLLAMAKTMAPYRFKQFIKELFFK